MKADLGFPGSAFAVYGAEMRTDLAEAAVVVDSSPEPAGLFTVNGRRRAGLRLAGIMAGCMICQKGSGHQTCHASRIGPGSK